MAVSSRFAGSHLLVDAAGAVVHELALPALANIAAVDINAAGRAVVCTSVTSLNLVAIDADGSTAYATPGLGDIVVPEAALTDYPTILDHVKPRLRAYPKETVVAEKFEAMVKPSESMTTSPNWSP